ncbi:MAG: ImmA/IrrE family metallo-endopeptidase [Lewinellaceae bacterium]|nr:ImmA/IrrE family metallo-endopeptidase [Lewinellaceae bacterium]
MKRSTSKLAYVTPALLVWARESRGFDVETAAKKIGVTIERLGEWESGQNWPTFSQLQKLALDVYKRPSAVFFRKTLPPENPLSIEFRTLLSSRIEQISPETRLAIRQAKHLQNLQREILEAKPAPFILGDFKLDINRPVQETALEFRSFLGLEIEEQKAWKDHSSAFKSLRVKLEESGIGVFQLGFPIEEARGFAIFGDPSIIILNSHDSQSGRIFTLVHETCHLLLKVSSMLTNFKGGVIRREYIHLEKFCNNFSGEFLLPEKHFLPLAQSFNLEKDAWTESQLTRLASIFKTSKEVVLRRLVHHGLATSTFMVVKKRFGMRLFVKKKKRNSERI